jgi:hypothetical protein
MQEYRATAWDWLIIVIIIFIIIYLTTCEIFYNRRGMKGHQSMHRATPRRIGIQSRNGGNEIAGSDMNEPHLVFVVKYREAAKRKQEVFETEEEAIQFARTKDPNFRRNPVQETEAQASERVLLECTNKLSAHGKTIADATDFFIQHLIANEKSCTAKELVDEFIAAKQKEAASQFDLDDLRSRLATFSQRFSSHLVETITSAQIDDWLRSLNVSVITRNHYRRLIMLAFNFAVQRGYANSNPVFGRFVVSRAGNC